MSYHQFYIALMTFELHIEAAQSLKAKRSVTTRVKECIKSEFNAAIAEVGFQEKWQRAAFALTLVANDKKILQKDLAALEEYVGAIADVTVTGIHVEWL